MYIYIYYIYRLFTSIHNYQSISSLSHVIRYTRNVFAILVIVWLEQDCLLLVSSATSFQG